MKNGVLLPVDHHANQLPDRTGLSADTVVANRYRLISKIGAGGMGTVYVAQHLTIYKMVAIKVLSQVDRVHQVNGIARFLQEARSIAKIEHPHIVQIFDFGEVADGTPFLVMELLRGHDLHHVLQKTARPLSWSRVVHISMQICDALQTVHNFQIVHRDLKPSNCFKIQWHGDDDYIKVLDFGAAKHLDPNNLSGVTRNGPPPCTPEYAAPEQLEAKSVDHRADIYALGVIVFELATARRPFAGSEWWQLLTDKKTGCRLLPSQLESTLSPAIDTVILRALEADPQRRFQSMREFSDALMSTKFAATTEIQTIRDQTAPLILCQSQTNTAKQIDNKFKFKKLVFAIGGSVAIASSLVVFALDHERPELALSTHRTNNDESAISVTTDDSRSALKDPPNATNDDNQHSITLHHSNDELNPHAVEPSGLLLTPSPPPSPKPTETLHQLVIAKPKIDDEPNDIALLQAKRALRSIAAALDVNPTIDQRQTSANGTINVALRVAWQIDLQKIPADIRDILRLKKDILEIRRDDLSGNKLALPIYQYLSEHIIQAKIELAGRSIKWNLVIVENCHGVCQFSGSSRIRLAPKFGKKDEIAWINGIDRQKLATAENPDWQIIVSRRSKID